MFNRKNQTLNASTLDPVIRAASIVKLTWVRNLLIVTSLFVTIVVLATSMGGRQAPAAALISAFMQWIMLLKFDSNIQLLRMITSSRRRSSLYLDLGKDVGVQASIGWTLESGVQWFGERSNLAGKNA